MRLKRGHLLNYFLDKIESSGPGNITLPGSGFEWPKDEALLLTKVCLLISIYFLKYEPIVRSSASSFGHSDPDPDPSSVCIVASTNTCYYSENQIFYSLE